MNLYIADGIQTKNYQIDSRTTIKDLNQRIIVHTLLFV